MSRKLLYFVVVLALLTVLTGPLTAQDDIPTVAIIRLGPLPPFEYSQQGTLDVLAAYGYVDGENINLILGDAAMDVPTANLLIEDAIDQGADVIITITTPVSQAAVNATLEMEDPPRHSVQYCNTALRGGHRSGSVPQTGSCLGFSGST